MACADALAKLTAPKRQRVNWTVEALGDVRLKLAYEPGVTKTKHSYKITIVNKYLGPGAPEPEAPDPDPKDATPALPGQAPSNVAARSDGMIEAAGSATASGVPCASAEVLMARALMLMTSENARDSLGQAQYTFHERLGGGVAGRVYRVADVHGRVLAAKRARQPSDNLSLLAEAQLQLAGGTHPNLLQLQDIALKCTQKMPQRVDVLCLIFPCALCDFAQYITRELNDKNADHAHRIRAARDALAAVLPAIAHLHSHNIVHADIKPMNMLLQAQPLARSFDGRRLVLADFSHSYMNDPQSRWVKPLELILKEKALNVCTANYRAPELHYGMEAYTNLIDEWSAGVVALETIRGVRWPVEGKAGAEKPAMRQVFGSAALRRLFGGAALFQTLEGGFPESGPGAAPGAELDGHGRQVVQSLLSLDPAARGQASELSKSNWFLERSVLQRTISGRGDRGPFAVAEAFMGEDLLALRGQE